MDDFGCTVDVGDDSWAFWCSSFKELFYAGKPAGDIQSDDTTGMEGT